jgi:phosphatidylglycerol:prolipoprotein diacylglycerol transferase
VFVVFVALYAVARFLLEILRRDDRGGLGGLSTSQGLGLALLVVAAAIHGIRRRAAHDSFAPAR